MCSVRPSSLQPFGVQPAIVHWIFQQEYWSGLPFPPPGDLPDPGIKPAYPALAGGFFTISSTQDAHNISYPCIFLKSTQHLEVKREVFPHHPVDLSCPGLSGPFRACPLLFLYPVGHWHFVKGESLSSWSLTSPKDLHPVPLRPCFLTKQSPRPAELLTEKVNLCSV